MSEKTTTVESLLGVLSLGPQSGYEIRQFMEKSTANFWSESFGQIYPALKNMLADGLIEAAEQGTDARPAKKVYRITAAGHERLRAWLSIPARPQVNRIELLLKLFFGDRAAPGAMQAQLRAAHARAAADLQRYTAIEQHMEREYAAMPGMPFWRMTVRFGLAEARATLDWAEAALKELHAIENAN
jgi:PadR family transcriptional regulator AphA